MPKEFKPGWTYIKSSGLKQKVAVNNKTGMVYCEDGAIYKPEEIKIMDKAGKQITPEIHLVKKMFGGEITEFIYKEAESD
ncbi:MAG: hypothetical protein LBQ88_16895 [Treponema sp.]|jgi:hypothetical protein|nr:hypothetical protein [Treponema sp.]